ncbi:MAG: response regulator [Bdellovibrionales bacterium]
MIIDDSETLRAQLRRCLEDSGYLVVEGIDGLDGLDRIQQESVIDLIICDVNMPKMDGLTMISKLRQMDKWKATPVLMLTTESGADLKAKGKEVGVRAWVTKPYNQEALLNAIKKIAVS